MLKSWVAVRKLESPGTSLEIKLGAPEQVTDYEWRCAYSVGDEENYAHGLDAFQALVMALTGIRVALDSAGQQLTWTGGSAGDHGVPRMVPHALGLDFSQKIEKFIDSEVSQFAETASRSKTLR